MMNKEFFIIKYFNLKRAVYFYSAFFILIGCKKADDGYSVFSDEISTVEYAFDSLIKISINEKFFSRYEQKQVLNDSLFIGLRPLLRNNRLDIINLFEPETNYSIDLKDKLNGDPSTFFVHNRDSLLIMMNDLNGFAWLDLAGNYYSSFSFGVNENQYFDVLPYIQVKPIYFKGKVIFNYRHIGLLEDSKYLEQTQMAIFDLKTGVLTKFGEGGFLRDYLNNKEVNTDFYSPNYVINNKGELVMSYPFYPYLLIYNLKTLELVQKVPLRSNKVLQMSAPTTKKIHDDNFQNAIYRAGIATFFDLNFHEEINKYSILFMHPYQSLDENGKLKEWDERSSSLLVLDEDFKVEKEILFSAGDLLMNASISLSTGLLFAKHIKNENQENYLHYNYFISLQ